MIEELLYLDSISRLPTNLALELAQLSEDQRTDHFSALSKELEKWLLDEKAMESDEGKIWISKLEKVFSLLQPITDHSLRGRIRFNTLHLKSLLSNESPERTEILDI